MQCHWYPLRIRLSGKGSQGGPVRILGETGEKDDFGRVDSRPLVWIKIPNASTVIVGEP